MCLDTMNYSFLLKHWVHNEFYEKLAKEHGFMIFQNHYINRVVRNANPEPYCVRI